VSLDAVLGVSRGTLSLELALGVPDGQVVALLGPNGAGKTTALRALAGLQPLDSGHVAVDGEVFEGAGRRRVPPEGRGLGVVFSDHLLFAHLDARDNVAFRSARTAARTASRLNGRFGR
jgi:molybdate transport system ATP-binding protein